MNRQSNGLILSLLLFIVFPVIKGNAQCCSTGSPVGASVNVGILGKKTFRSVIFYRNSFSDTYYQDDHSTDKNTALSHAGYNFMGETFSYGITRRLTVEADFGYFFNKTQVFKTIDYTEKGYGMSNGGVTLKYGIYMRPLKQFEVTGGLGFRYPFSFTPQMQDGKQLNPDVQPSTHAFGASAQLFLNKGFPEITLRIFSINKYDYNFPDRNNYKYGNILTNSLFASKKIVKNLYGILQVRSEWKSHDKHESITTGEIVNTVNSGYELVTVTPQLSYSLANLGNFSVLYDIPVYKYYYGKQLTPSYSFAVSYSHDFNFGPKYK